MEGTAASHRDRRGRRNRRAPDRSRACQGRRARSHLQRGASGVTRAQVEVTPVRLATAADVAAAAQLACLLEASAPKPGNVSPGRHFADTRYEDFLASAAAVGGPLAGAGTRPVGATVRLAMEATRRWTRSNTNLGIVL